MVKRLCLGQETEAFQHTGLVLFRSDTALSLVVCQKMFRRRAVPLSGEFFWPNKIPFPKARGVAPIFKQCLASVLENTRSYADFLCSKDWFNGLSYNHCRVVVGYLKTVMNLHTQLISKHNKKLMRLPPFIMRFMLFFFYSKETIQVSIVNNR